MAHNRNTNLNKFEFVDAVVGSGAVGKRSGVWGWVGFRGVITSVSMGGNTSTRGEKYRIIV